MKNILLPLFTWLLLIATAQAQQSTGQLELQLNKTILQPGDSLIVTVDYKDSSQISNHPFSTLDMIIENEQGRRTRLRWPVINGKASGALYLPDSIPTGKYTLLVGLQPRFFEVVGKIRDKKITSIQALLLTKTGQWAEQQVPVAPNGTFDINNWLFEENGLIAFSRINSNRPLNISINTQLDSSFKPTAVAGRTFYIGNPPAGVQQSLQLPVKVTEATFTDEGTILPAVVVRGTTKNRAQQFNEKYVSGLFQSVDAQLIDVMDDPSAISYPDIFSYLQGRVAGLQIAPLGFGGGMARWRGSWVAFFLDEMRVPAQQLANVPMADIAIVKAFPPPFIGSPGGGGAIAVYTRRGGEGSYLPANRQVFKVRGYTPSAVVLNMNKLIL